MGNSSRKATNEEKATVQVLAKSSSAIPADDHKNLPTLLQWVKKQPNDRDGNTLIRVDLIFFAGAYPSHTLVTSVFRARLKQSEVSQTSLEQFLEAIESENAQLYVRVSPGQSGDFELIRAKDESYKTTVLRWIGSSDPRIGCAITYHGE